MSITSVKNDLNSSDLKRTEEGNPSREGSHDVLSKEKTETFAQGKLGSASFSSSKGEKRESIIFKIIFTAVNDLLYFLRDGGEEITKLIQNNGTVSDLILHIPEEIRARTGLTKLIEDLKEANPEEDITKKIEDFLKIWQKSSDSYRQKMGDQNLTPAEKMAGKLFSIVKSLVSADKKNLQKNLSLSLRDLLDKAEEYLFLVKGSYFSEIMSQIPLVSNKGLLGQEILRSFLFSCMNLQEEKSLNACIKIWEKFDRSFQGEEGDFQLALIELRSLINNPSLKEEERDILNCFLNAFQALKICFIRTFVPYDYKATIPLQVNLPILSSEAGKKFLKQSVFFLNAFIEKQKPITVWRTQMNLLEKQKKKIENLLTEENIVEKIPLLAPILADIYKRGVFICQNNKQISWEEKLEFSSYLLFLEQAEIYFELLDELRIFVTPLPDIDEIIEELGGEKERKTATPHYYEIEEEIGLEKEEPLQEEEEEKSEEETFSSKGIETETIKSHFFYRQIAKKLDNLVPSYQKESQNHLLLAAQSLHLLKELTCDKQRPDLAGIAVQMFLVDMHITVEQYLRGLLDGPDKVPVRGVKLFHDLSFLLQQVKDAGKEVSQELEEFCKIWRVAQLEARYPLHYFSSNSPAAEQIRFWRYSQENSPERRQEKVEQLLSAYQQILQIQGRQDPEVIETIEDIKKSLSEIEFHAGRPEESLSGKAQSYRKKGQALEKKILLLKTKLQKKAPLLSKEQKQKQWARLAYLQEIAYYLKWMEQAEQIQVLYSKETKKKTVPKWLQFFLFRGSLYLDKLFDLLDHAYKGIVIHENTRFTHVHKNYSKEWEEEDQLEEEASEIVSRLNLGISHHYLDTTSAPLTARKVDAIYKRIFQISKVGSQSSNRRIKGLSKEESDQMKSLLDQGYSLFERSVDKLLQKMEKELELEEVKEEKTGDISAKPPTKKNRRRKKKT